MKKNTNTTTKKSSKKSNTSTPAGAAPVTPAASTSAAPAPAPTPISAADAAQCQALLSQIDGVLGPVTSLSADDIRRSLKLKKGGAQVVTQLVALCNQHGVTAVGPVTTDTMSAQKARADTLNQIGVQYAAVGKKLSDATFSAESTTWQYATALYTVLQRLSLMDPTLAQGLQPVQAFFQTKKTKGKKRTKEDNQKLVAVQKLSANHEASSSEAAAAPPAAAPPAAASAGSSAGASNGTSGSAPVAAPPAPANGIAHS
jgi:hypothetical protein